MPNTIDSTSTIAYSSWLALGVAAIGMLVTGPSVGAQIGGSDLGENNAFSEWFGYLVMSYTSCKNENGVTS